jgi:hypothetical protein
VSVIRSAILAEFPRLRALWPALTSKPEHLSEIGKAIMRHEDRLTPDDVTRGFDRVILETPTSAYPPGPHEVLRSVMAEMTARKARTLPGRRPQPGGVTFAEWWSSLDPDERSQHEALARMMDRTAPVMAGIPEEDEEW